MFTIEASTKSRNPIAHSRTRTSLPRDVARADGGGDAGTAFAALSIAFAVMARSPVSGKGVSNPVACAVVDLAVEGVGARWSEAGRQVPDLRLVGDDVDAHDQVIDDGEPDDADRVRRVADQAPRRPVDDHRLEQGDEPAG